MKVLLTIMLATLSTIGTAQKKLPSTYDLVIGTYTNSIHVYRFYVETGRLAYLSQVDGLTNPSYLTASADNKFIYAVNETDKGSVSALKFEPNTGKLELINSQQTGSGPAHVSIDKDRKNIFVSNYGGGSLTVLPVNKDGSLGPANQTIQYEGGSVNKERQDRPHAHSSILSPDEKHLFVADLGTDKINVYRYRDSKVPPLTAETPAFANAKPGNGPRHMEFSIDGKFLYVVNELTATVSVYSVDGAKLKEIQTVPMVDESYKGKVGAADIHITPNGKFLYASNREDANEIIIYVVNPDGKLTFMERTRTAGTSPRNFIIDPTGRFILIANQKTNNIVVLSIDQKTGRLYATRNKIEIDSPVCLKLVPVE